MVLIRNLVEAKYGSFADLMRCHEELNEIAAAHGWKRSRFMVQAGARANVLAAELEYDSLSEWEVEQEGAYSDPQFMKVLREASQYCVQGTASEQIWLDAPHLA